MAKRILLSEGMHYRVSAEGPIRVTAAGLRRITEVNSSGDKAVIEIDGVTIIEFLGT